MRNSHTIFASREETVELRCSLIHLSIKYSKLLASAILTLKAQIWFEMANYRLQISFGTTHYILVNFFLCSHGTQVLSLKPFIQPMVNLLGDPSGPVRDAAIQTLIEVYKHVG